jgi:F-type H+-transporting ATPase subunit c
MRFVKTVALAFTLMLLTSAVASAQAPTTGAVNYPFSQLREFSAGLVILAAAMGIGGLAKGAVESMARQPEIAGQIQTAMIIAAALIEGATFFALIIIGFV